jgi:hypothetical protein
MDWVHELASKMDRSAYARFTGKEKPKYVRVEEPLTGDVIERHLRSEQPIAAYVLSDPNAGKGHVVVFDFDDHDGTSRDIEQIVATFCVLLRDRGVPYTVVQSGGGHGYHIFIVFETAKRKDVLRDGAKRLLAAFNYEGRTFVEGTNGVDNGQIEIFPKGDGTRGGLYPIALPLSRKSVLVALNERNGVLTLPHYGNEHRLPVIKNSTPGPRSKSGSKAIDADAAFAALVSKRDPANYDDWYKVAMRMIAAFGVDDVWARQTWIAWAQTAPNADSEHELVRKWADCRSTRLSPATFWLEARDNGYAGDTPFSKTDLAKHQVLDFASEFETFRSQDDETFACIAPRSFVPVRSRAFKACIRRAAFEAGRMLKSDDLNTVVETLDAQALAAPVTDFALRFAAHGDKRYLFLADDSCTVIEIDSDGYRVCEQPPVRFRRGDDRALPPPEPGTLDDFRTFANVDDDNLPFLLAWMVSCVVRPGCHMPIAILTGPAGSAKSSLLQLVVDMLDPKAGLRAGMPSKEDDLVVAAHQGAIVSFDNATTLAPLSDALCRLATGGGLRKRTLYTDKDVTSIDVIRPVIIAGIDPTAYQQDLIERLLLIELQRPDRRIDDETLARMIRDAHPRLIGFLLTLVSSVLATYEAVEVDCTRMAGFAKVGEAVARLLGHPEGWFVDRYMQMLADSAEDGADADCVFTLIVMLVANMQGRFKMTSQQLLDDLNLMIGNETINAARADIPATPRAMTNRINRVIPALRQLRGIEIVKDKHDRSWRITPPDVATDDEVFASVRAPF